ncbi:hypothetical protein [Streptomyces sp. NPDC058145]|uniref:hypothetical protein n=1 Tax=Streptomyces sp. NPDC058145 TaxID=3346356 RepID=UPI0036EEAAA8
MDRRRWGGRRRHRPGRRTAGIALSAMDLSPDGVRVKERLWGGEPAFSVLARPAACGRSLSD